MLERVDLWGGGWRWCLMMHGGEKHERAVTKF